MVDPLGQSSWTTGKTYLPGQKPTTNQILYPYGKDTMYWAGTQFAQPDSKYLYGTDEWLSEQKRLLDQERIQKLVGPVDPKDIEDGWVRRGLFDVEISTGKMKLADRPGLPGLGITGKDMTIGVMNKAQVDPEQVISDERLFDLTSPVTSSGAKWRDKNPLLIGASRGAANTLAAVGNLAAMFMDVSSLGLAHLSGASTSIHEKANELSEAAGQISKYSEGPAAASLHEFKNLVNAPFHGFDGSKFLNASAEMLTDQAVQMLGMKGIGKLVGFAGENIGRAYGWAAEELSPKYGGALVAGLKKVGQSSFKVLGAEIGFKPLIEKEMLRGFGAVAGANTYYALRDHGASLPVASIAALSSGLISANTWQLPLDEALSGKVASKVFKLASDSGVFKKMIARSLTTAAATDAQMALEGFLQPLVFHAAASIDSDLTKQQILQQTLNSWSTIPETLYGGTMYGFLFGSYGTLAEKALGSINFRPKYTVSPEAGEAATHIIASEFQPTQMPDGTVVPTPVDVGQISAETGMVDTNPTVSTLPRLETGFRNINDRVSSLTDIHQGIARMTAGGRPTDVGSVADALGVSVANAAEAIRSLHEKGLVQIDENRGITAVTDHPPEVHQQLVEDAARRRFDPKSNELFPLVKSNAEANTGRWKLSDEADARGQEAGEIATMSANDGVATANSKVAEDQAAGTDTRDSRLVHLQEALTEVENMTSPVHANTRRKAMLGEIRDILVEAQAAKARGEKGMEDSDLEGLVHLASVIAGNSRARQERTKEIFNIVQDLRNESPGKKGKVVEKGEPLDQKIKKNLPKIKKKAIDYQIARVMMASRLMSAIRSMMAGHIVDSKGLTAEEAIASAREALTTGHLKGALTLEEFDHLLKAPQDEFAKFFGKRMSDRAKLTEQAVDQVLKETADGLQSTDPDASRSMRSVLNVGHYPNLDVVEDGWEPTIPDVLTAANESYTMRPETMLIGKIGTRTSPTETSLARLDKMIESSLHSPSGDPFTMALGRSGTTDARGFTLMRYHPDSILRDFVTAHTDPSGHVYVEGGNDILNAGQVMKSDLAFRYEREGHNQIFNQKIDEYFGHLMDVYNKMKAAGITSTKSSILRSDMNAARRSWDELMAMTLSKADPMKVLDNLGTAGNSQLLQELNNHGASVFEGKGNYIRKAFEAQGHFPFIRELVFNLHGSAEGRRLLYHLGTEGKVTLRDIVSALQSIGSVDPTRSAEEVAKEFEKNSFYPHPGLVVRDFKNIVKMVFSPMTVFTHLAMNEGESVALSGVATYDALASAWAGRNNKSKMEFWERLNQAMITGNAAKKTGFLGLMTGVITAPGRLLSRVTDFARRSSMLLDDNAALALHIHEVMGHALHHSGMLEEILPSKDLGILARWLGAPLRKMTLTGELDPTFWSGRPAEKFAHALEMFFALGKSPRPELDDAFNTMSLWTADFYRGLKDGIVRYVDDMLQDPAAAMDLMSREDRELFDKMALQAGTGDNNPTPPGPGQNGSYDYKTALGWILKDYADIPRKSGNLTLVPGKGGLKFANGERGTIDYENLTERQKFAVRFVRASNLRVSDFIMPAEVVGVFGKLFGLSKEEIEATGLIGVNARWAAAMAKDAKRDFGMDISPMLETIGNEVLSLVKDRQVKVGMSFEEWADMMGLPSIDGIEDKGLTRSYRAEYEKRLPDIEKAQRERELHRVAAAKIEKRRQYFQKLVDGVWKKSHVDEYYKVEDRSPEFLVGNTKFSAEEKFSQKELQHILSGSGNSAEVAQNLINILNEYPGKKEYTGQEIIDALDPSFVKVLNPRPKETLVAQQEEGSNVLNLVQDGPKNAITSMRLGRLTHFTRRINWSGVDIDPKEEYTLGDVENITRKIAYTSLAPRKHAIGAREVFDKVSMMLKSSGKNTISGKELLKLVPRDSLTALPIDVLSEPPDSRYHGYGKLDKYSLPPDDWADWPAQHGGWNGGSKMMFHADRPPVRVSDVADVGEKKTKERKGKKRKERAIPKGAKPDLQDVESHLGTQEEMSADQIKDLMHMFSTMDKDADVSRTFIEMYDQKWHGNSRGRSPKEVLDEARKEAIKRDIAFTRRQNGGPVEERFLQKVNSKVQQININRRYALINWARTAAKYAGLELNNKQLADSMARTAHYIWTLAGSAARAAQIVGIIPSHQDPVSLNEVYHGAESFSDIIAEAGSFASKVAGKEGSPLADKSEMLKDLRVMMTAQRLAEIWTGDQARIAAGENVSSRIPEKEALDAQFALLHLQYKWGDDYPILDQFGRRISQWAFDSVIEPLYHAGMISSDARERIMSAGERYSPLYRMHELIPEEAFQDVIMDDSVKDVIKMLRGGVHEDGMLDPFDALISKAIAVKLITDKQAMKNKIGEFVKQVSNDVFDTEADIHALHYYEPVRDAEGKIMKDKEGKPVYKKKAVSSKDEYKEYFRMVQKKHGKFQADKLRSKIFASWKDGTPSFWVVNDPDLMTAFSHMNEQALSLTFELSKAATNNGEAKKMNAIDWIARSSRQTMANPIVLGTSFLWNMPWKDVPMALSRSINGLLPHDIIKGFVMGWGEAFPSLQKIFPKLFYVAQEADNTMSNMAGLMGALSDPARQDFNYHFDKGKLVYDGKIGGALKAIGRDFIRKAADRGALFLTHAGREQIGRMGKIKAAKTIFNSAYQLGVTPFRIFGEYMEQSVRMSERVAANRIKFDDLPEPLQQYYLDKGFSPGDKLSFDSIHKRLLWSMMKGAALERIKETGKISPEDEKLLPPIRSGAETNYAQRNLTVDFAMSGLLSKLTNAMALFSQPNFNDFGSFMDAMSGKNPTLKRVGYVAKTLAFVGMPFMLDMLWHWNDDDYKHESLYEKLSYLHLKKNPDGTFHRVPWGIGAAKSLVWDPINIFLHSVAYEEPQLMTEGGELRSYLEKVTGVSGYKLATMGYLADYLMEQGPYNFMYDSLKETVKGWASGNLAQVMHGIGSIGPAITDPLVDVATNWDSWRERPIAADDYGEVLPQDINRERYSWVTQKLNKVLPFLQPAQVEYLIRKYVPGLHYQVAEFASTLAGQAGLDTGTARSSNDVIAGALSATRNSPSPWGPSSEPVKNFVQLYLESQKVYNTVTKLQKSESVGDQERATKLAATPLYRVYPTLSSYWDAYKAYRDSRAYILKDTGLSRAEKRVALVSGGEGINGPDKDMTLMAIEAMKWALMDMSGTGDKNE